MRVLQFHDLLSHEMPDAAWLSPAGYLPVFQDRRMEPPTSQTAIQRLLARLAPYNYRSPSQVIVLVASNAFHTNPRLQCYPQHGLSSPDVLESSARKAKP